MTTAGKARTVLGNHLVLFVGVGSGILLWFLEAVLHVAVFRGDDLLRQVIAPEMHEAWMRLLSIGILVSYSVYAQVVVAGRRRAERALRENHSWLATTLRSIGDAVIATDSEGNISL
ncbi:MAG: hypothetical protein ACYSU0_13515, partial [Planctomycetota bacterium]